MMMPNPYVVPYQEIHAIVHENQELVELIELPSCFGGGGWALHHYSKRQNVIEARQCGNSFRYLVRVGRCEEEFRSPDKAAGIVEVDVVDDRVFITYGGLGGGGVGATLCRALAKGVVSHKLTPSGGEKYAEGVLELVGRRRVVIGVDNTDSKDRGATWALVHNVARAVKNSDVVYLSHAIVQLYPVSKKTQNCTATVVEFGCVRGKEDELVDRFCELVLEHTLSDETGVAVWVGFDCSHLLDFSRRARHGWVELEDALELRNNGVRFPVEGDGVIGAVASLPYYSRVMEAPKIDWESASG